MVRLSEKTIREIEKILSSGYNAEVKKNAGKIDVVKIDRKVTYTTPTTG